MLWKHCKHKGNPHALEIKTIICENFLNSKQIQMPILLNEFVERNSLYIHSQVRRIGVTTLTHHEWEPH